MVIFLEPVNQTVNLFMQVSRGKLTSDCKKILLSLTWTSGDFLIATGLEFKLDRETLNLGMNQPFYFSYRRSLDRSNGLFTLHGTRNGIGKGNYGFLYYSMYCTHHTVTGTETGNHCFLLCPSQYLSLSRSRAVQCVWAISPVPVQGQCEHFYLKPHNLFVHVSAPVLETASVIKP